MDMKKGFWLTAALGALLSMFGDLALGQSKGGSARSRAVTRSSGKAKALKPDDLFPRKRILDVRITVPEAGWDTIRRQRRTFFTALQAKRKYAPIDGPYTYVTASVTIDGVEFPAVGLRKKGFIGSQSSTRPSLKVKLNHVDKQAHIGGMTNLTFNNGKQDVSGLSQFMGYALFNAAGSPASRCSLAKITVNGRELGIYQHVESIRKPMIKRLFGNDTGTLYEGTVVDFAEDWEGSFERKFGDDKHGREQIKKLIKALRGGDGTPILRADAIGRGWVPTNSRQDRRWTAVGYSDSKWRQGRNGAGYEADRGYEDLISKGLDFKAEMDGKASSVYLRFPFQVANLSQLTAAGRLVLRIKYDDGFVAYLNGTKVAAINAPDKPRWNSKATGPHGDEEAKKFQSIDITKYRGKLRTGKNVLAIHGLNNSIGSADLLIVAEIQVNDHDLEQAVGELVDLDSFYTYWAVEGLLGFWDGYSGNANNFFVYLNPTTDKFHFLPWGADCMFEKYSKIDRNYKVPLSVKTKGLVAHKLYQLESVRERYAKTMKGLLRKHWSEKALLAETKRIEKMLKPHRYPARESQARRSTEGIRRFIRERRSDMLDEVSGSMPIWTAVPPTPYIMGRDPGPDRRGSEEKERGEGEDTIWGAAMRGDVDKIGGHLARGVAVDAPSDKRDTPLMLAALAGRREAVQLLLSKGADPNARNHENQTALINASFLGRIEIVKMLIHNQAKVNTRNVRGESPLDVCWVEWSEAIEDLVDTLASLLDFQADHNEIKAGRRAVRGYLLQNGAKSGRDIPADKAEAKHIWMYAKSGDLEGLKKHIADGTDLNARDGRGVTPLSWASMAGQLEAAGFLLKNGAKADARNQDGATPLISAAFFGHTKIVDLLLKQQADVNAQNNKGETALDTVSGVWSEELEGFYKYLAGALTLKLDLASIKQARPEVVRVLRKNRGKLGRQLR